MSSEIDAPGFFLRMMEGRVGLEASHLLMQLPILRFRAQKGHGEPILVLPGFLADDNSTLVLRQYLKSLNYDVEGWGLGVNRIPMLELLPRVHDHIERVASEHGTGVRLVGWSRGGIIAREIARDYPELVDRVITIGTPVKGGVEVSSIGYLVRRTTGLSSRAMSQILRERQQKKIQVPIKAIFSKLDGVVAWEACIDDMNPDVEHIEVSCSHSGMGVSAEVFKQLPDLLRG